jgi:hypothetical protein
MIEVKLPLPPKSMHPNGRATWKQVAGDKNRYMRHCAEALFAIKGLTPLKWQLKRAVVRREYAFRTAHRHDPDNLIAWAKSAIDSLVVAGILADDRELFYRHPEQKKADKEQLEGSLTITVEPLKPGEGVCPVCGRT